MTTSSKKLLVLCACLWIAACSSDNGTAPTDDGNGGGGGGGNTVEDTLRMQTLDDVAQQIDGWWNDGPDSVAARAVAYLSSIPVFEAVGRAGAKGVWARFDDGRLLIIPNNLEPGAPEDTLTLLDGEASIAPAPPAVRRPRVVGAGRDALRALNVPARGVELPSSNQFRVWDGIDGCFLTPKNRIRTLLRDAGYVEAPASSPTVDGFKNVHGDGVFVLFSHGGSGELVNKAKTYAVWTSTNVALPTEAQYQSMWDNFELAYMMMRGRDAGGGCSTTTNYGVTPAFVASRMHFAKNSLVYLNVCESGTADAADLRQAFANAGASVCVGWDGPLTVGFTYRTLPYFIDRLLGANAVDPKEDPEQRAFNAYDVRDNMAAKGRTVDPVGGGQFNVFKLKDDFGLLAPSIQFLSLEEQGDKAVLIIAGVFGTDPGGGNRQVKINDQALDVIEWQPTLITCDIPETGSNASGTVVVEVGEGANPRRSNPVNLTEWLGTLVYERDDPGSLAVRMEINVHFRADIHSFRDLPGEHPYETTVLFSAMHESSVAVTTSGSYAHTEAPCTDTFTFSGGLDLQSPYDPIPEGSWTYFGSVDSQSHTLQLNLSVMTLYNVGSWVRSGATECGLATVPLYGVLKVEDCLFDDLTGVKAFRMQMSSDYDVSTDNRGPCGVDPLVTYLLGLGLTAQASIHWDEMATFYPPDPETAR